MPRSRNRSQHLPRSLQQLIVGSPSRNAAVITAALHCIVIDGLCRIASPSASGLADVPRHSDDKRDGDGLRNKRKKRIIPRSALKITGHSATNCVTSIKTALSLHSNRSLRNMRDASASQQIPTAACAPHLRLYRSRMTNIEKDRRSGLLFRLRQAYQPQGFI